MTLITGWEHKCSMFLEDNLIFSLKYLMYILLDTVSTLKKFNSQNIHTNCEKINIIECFSVNCNSKNLETTQLSLKWELHIHVMEY